MGIEPVPGEPAAVASCDGECILVVADYHAGIESGLRREGVELDSCAAERRESIRALLDRTEPDRLLVLGDLANAIGTPRDVEREEIVDLLEVVAGRVPVTLVKGNHDGAIEDIAGSVEGVSLAPGSGTRIGTVGFAHGHTWPSPDVLSAEVLCTAHEHPVVTLEDEVGGGRVERVWLRGDVEAVPFVEFHGESVETPDEMVIFPAFNDLSGGTWVNVNGGEFLSPFLPAAIPGAQAYFLDGTRLGRYDSV